MAHETSRAHVAILAIFAIAVALAGCGGGDNATTAVSDVQANSEAGADDVETETSSPAATEADSDDATDASTTQAKAVRTGNLPSACSLLSSESVAAAIGGPATPQKDPPTPTPISTRCAWSEGEPHSLALDVRAGENAKNTFNNTIVGGFTAIPAGSAEAGIMLGARESDHDYRLVILEALYGDYYVHLTLQGPDRDDGAATQVASALAAEVFKALG